MRLSLLQIMEVTGGGEIGGTQVGNTFSTFHTDSREVAQGGVFFALRGAEMDGHRFVGDAIERGAAAVVVDRRMGIPSGIAEVVVADTWKAFYALAAYVLERVKPLVVGVTGSNGKTSTKEMAAAVLATHFNVLRTTGNLNTETGVPLTILKLEREHTALVVEMGLQRAGDISRLVALARPKIGVITNIGVVHMEFFESQTDLAQAKGELVAGLPEDGRAVLNADDSFFAQLTLLSAAPVSTFGMASGRFRVEDYVPLPGGGSEFSVLGERVRLALGGRHQALNAAAALAAGDAAGVPVAEGAPALSDIAVEHRLEQKQTPDGVGIVDDSYNASPESMSAAFATVRELPREGRLLAVLGHMGELGGLADGAHEQIGQVAGQVFDAIAVVDTPLGRILAHAAGAEVVPDNAAAVRWVRKHARKGDLVLVKGSHSRRLDEVVAELVK
jgi:UDP-N-acetylmuramoyl-tripeptide--D-alanyl-D-alanine ligase